eukprot:9286666-Alexandrium_andersonii.AAC.1
MTTKNHEGKRGKQPCKPARAYSPPPLLAKPRTRMHSKRLEDLHSEEPDGRTGARLPPRAVLAP